jgi:hypothetical protein
MPTLLFLNGLRFFFYSNENDEPIHVHIIKGDAKGKVWLEPSIRVEYFIGFTNSEQKSILEAIHTHSENFKNKWNEHFSK